MFYFFLQENVEMRRRFVLQSAENWLRGRQSEPLDSFSSLFLVCLLEGTDCCLEQGAGKGF